MEMPITGLTAILRCCQKAPGLRIGTGFTNLELQIVNFGNYMGSLVKKRRKKMSKHKYRKRLRANRHKRK